MHRSYEIGFILNPETTEEEAKKITDMVISLAEKNEGKVEKVDEWGRKKMAFAIENHDEGIYSFINATMDGSNVAELEKRIKLNEKVMRYIIVRLDERMRKSNRLVKKWKRHDERRSRDNASSQASTERAPRETPPVKKEEKDGE